MWPVLGWDSWEWLSIMVPKECAEVQRVLGWSHWGMAEYNRPQCAQLWGGEAGNS